MVLFPKGGLGRVLLATIIISTIAYLTLNLVSFGGSRWISYVDFPVRFGLWRVCDTTQSGLCNQWSDSPFTSAIVNNTFNANKPGFIRTAQALEIVSIIFYIFAAALIIIGIIDLDEFPFEAAFLVAAILLFICIVFISATLGVMSKKGRNNHPLAFLDWAWWNGLVGLIMTIVCFFALIALILYMNFSASSPKMQKGSPVNSSWGQPGFHSMGMVGSPSPIIVPHHSTHQLSHYPNYNQYPQQYDSNNYWQQTPSNNYWQQTPSNNYFQQNYSDQFYQNPMTAYGGQSSAEQYFHNQSPSPIISDLALQYITQANDAQYQRQLLDPYRQYLHDPYLIHNYL